MFRKLATAFAVAAVLAIAAPSAALADDDNYTPHTPVAPTLGGSVAVTECVGNVPWIDYSVKLTDPDDQSTSHAVRLVIKDASHTYDVALGDLVDNQLSGKTLWPGASVDSQGKANGWPGWVYRNGQWEQTTGNFGWTRGAVTAELTVGGTELTVPLSYPKVTASCANAVSAADPVDGSPAAILPVTGLNVPVVPIGIAGGVIVLLGAALLIARRLRRH